MIRYPKILTFALAIIFPISLLYSQNAFLKEIRQWALYQGRVDSVHFEMVQSCKDFMQFCETGTGREIRQIPKASFLDSLLFSKSELNEGSPIGIYNFAFDQSQYIGLIVVAHGKYKPDLNFMTFSKKDGRLISEARIAHAYVDAGDVDLRTTKFHSKTSFSIYTWDFDEWPEDQPCTYQIEKFKITQVGEIVSVKKRTKNIKCKTDW